MSIETGLAAGSTVRHTTLGSYLIIARYGPANWAKWKNTAPELKIAARAAAMDLFSMSALPLPPADMLAAHAFHTGIFTELPPNFPDLSEDEKIRILNGIFTSQRGSPLGTDEKDPSVGWMALVDAAHFSSFVVRMGGKTGPLWQMYDIEVIPLNNDQNTLDIYDFMTSVHWASIPPTPPAPA